MRTLFLVVAVLSCSMGFAQDSKLAENYMDQGEYTKALKIYESVDSLIDLVQKTTTRDEVFSIERGYNATLQGKDSLANRYYQKAIKAIDSLPQLTYGIAYRFEQRNELDRAIAAYEKGMALNDKLNYNYQLSRLYGEKGDLEKMFDTNM